MGTTVQDRRCDTTELGRGRREIPIVEFDPAGRVILAWTEEWGRTTATVYAIDRAEHRTHYPARSAAKSEATIRLCRSTFHEAPLQQDFGLDW